MAFIGTKPANQVSANTIGDSSITTTKLVDGSVTTAKIADGAVVTVDIADGAVTSAKIADGTIVNADISATAAIATSKISGLATVATTGAYTDLTGRPTLATVATSGSATDLTTGTLPAARLPTSGVTAGSYTSSSITVDATGRITAASSGSSGGVTSVATGNGLQGGTITSTGTLSVACPGYNTVGSYVFGYMTTGTADFFPTSGSNYSAGGGSQQMQSGGYGGVAADGYGFRGQNNLSGTWKWMGATFQTGNRFVSGGDGWAVACRVA